MKEALFTLCFTLASLVGMTTLTDAAAEPQSFPTSAGPVKITPLNHASTLIEAGGKVIYLDPAKPVKFAGLPKADLILITDIHGDHRHHSQAYRQWRKQNLARLDDRSHPRLQSEARPCSRQTVSRQGPRKRLRSRLWWKAFLLFR